MKKLQLLTVLAVIFCLGLAHAGPKTEILVGEPVTEWDSATMLDIPGGIFPILGGGQLNGEFKISSDSAVYALDTVVKNWTAMHTAQDEPQSSSTA